MQSLIPRCRELCGVRSLLLLVLLISVATCLHAQSVAGSIFGIVADKTGAVIPGAQVLLRNMDEGATRTTTFDAAGYYQFVDAKAGRYDLQVSRDGFEKSDTAGIVLAVRQQLRQNVSLVVGSVQQVVQVSGDTVSAIDADTPTISAVYSAADIANLPVNTRASASGTSALGIVATLPGVQADHTNFALQGGLPFQTEVSIDGVTIQDPNGNTPDANTFPSSESLSEIRADGDAVF